MSAADAPTVFVATTPAAIIVDQRRAAVRRDPAARRCSTSRTPTPRCSGTRATAAYYYLVSGRWFAAPGLDGPWTFATAEPARGLRAHSRRRAARLRARVRARHAAGAGGAASRRRFRSRERCGRDAAKLDVVYAGAPKFAPIAGTPMSYAVNTSFNVIQTGEGYLRVLPGRVVRRARARRPVDARGERAAGRLHDPAREPDVPVHVRARVRGDARRRSRTATRRATR